MRDTGTLTTDSGKEDERCDIRVWSGACDHGAATARDTRFRCDLCETIAVLDHEVRHELFPHVSGDYDNLH